MVAAVFLAAAIGIILPGCAGSGSPASRDRGAATRLTSAPRDATTSAGVPWGSAADPYSADTYLREGGYRRADSAASAGAAVGLPAHTPTETLGRPITDVLYERSTDLSDPRGQVVVLLANRVRVHGRPVPADVKAVDEVWAAGADGVLDDIDGVPVMKRDPKDKVLLGQKFRQPAAVVWVWRGVQWAVYADTVPADQLVRVAASIIRQQTQAP